MAVPPHGRYAYVTNAGSGMVSSHSIVPSTGKIALLEAAAANTGAGSKPIDASVSADGHHL